MRQRCAIVLVVFIRGCLTVSKLHRVKLIEMGEELSWFGDLLEIHLCDLVHMLVLLDVVLEFCHVGQACG